MAEITADKIKELRERTGVGIGKCKEALVQANGDINQAIDILRKSGMASAVKKEGRETKEGKIGISEQGNRIAIVEVNAETDFVTNNEMFGTFLQNVADELAKSNPTSLEQFLAQKYSKDSGLTVDQYRATIVQAIGENIQIRRFKVVEKKPNASVGVYSHMNGKIVTLVELEGSNKETPFAKDIAMHVAAAAPDYVTPEQVPQNVLEHERDIARSQIKGKPENMIEKIVDGMINKFYTSVCLERQHYVKDDKKTVGDLVKEKAKESGAPLKLVTFTRWSVGQA